MRKTILVLEIAGGIATLLITAHILGLTWESVLIFMFGLVLRGVRWTALQLGTVGIGIENGITELRGRQSLV